MSKTFKNIVCSRFHQFFIDKIEDGEIDYNQVAEAFGKEKQGIYSFFNSLKTGHQSVTVEHILLAQKHFGLSANYLFGASDLAVEYSLPVVMEEGVELTFFDKSIGQKLKDIFERAKTNIKQYATERLKMTEQNLHKILRGEGRPYWDTVVTIAEDHGESLDNFRRVPLPKGHYLTQIKMQEEIIEGLKRELQKK